MQILKCGSCCSVTWHVTWLENCSPISESPRSLNILENPKIGQLAVLAFGHRAHLPSRFGVLSDKIPPQAF